MSMITDDLKSSYLSWLRDRIQLKDVNGAIEITTPLMDRHNDFLQLYVTDDGNGNLRITDAGYILSDLDLDGIDVVGSHRRKQLLELILNRHGVQISKSGELYVNSDTATFPQRKHMLLQAMVAVNDMFLMSRSNVTSVFFEEVAQFFDQYDIRNSSDVAFVGKTGFTHQFDFLIPRSKNQPERIVKSLNSINKQSASLLLFSWNDTKEMRRTESQLYVFINDTSKGIRQAAITALHQYDVVPVPWSKRLDHLPSLTA